MIISVNSLKWTKITRLSWKNNIIKTGGKIGQDSRKVECNSQIIKQTGLLCQT